MVLLNDIKHGSQVQGQACILTHRLHRLVRSPLYLPCQQNFPARRAPAHGSVKRGRYIVAVVHYEYNTLNKIPRPRENYALGTP